MRLFAALLLLLSSVPLHAQSAPQTRLFTHVDGVNVTNDSVISSENLQNVTREVQNHVYITKPERDIADIARSAMQNQGYFKAEVETNATKILNESTKKRTIAVTLRIRQGEQYRVSHITFSKNKEFSEARLRQAFPLNDGDVMSDQKVREGLEKLRGLYAAKGYMEAAAVPQVVADDSNHTLAIAVEVEECPQFTLLGLTLDEGPLMAHEGVPAQGHPWPADKAAKLEALSRSYAGSHNVGPFIEAIKRSLSEMFPGCNADSLDSLIGTTQGGDPPHATVNVIYPSAEECQLN